MSGRRMPGELACAPCPSPIGLVDPRVMKHLFLALLAALCGLGFAWAFAAQELSAYTMAVRAAEQALTAGDHARALGMIDRALERDARVPAAWELRARWAEATGQRDERIWSLHRELRARVALKEDPATIQALRERIAAIDPVARDLFAFKDRFIARLEEIAAQYEKDQRPHAGIRVHKEILAIDQERQSSWEAIQRLASAPDPSLAGDAKPRDLFEGVSKDWIAEYDAKHREWKEHGTLKKPNYLTRTNAGYETLVRCAEAMEQMNAFYRQFFDYGTDGGGVSPIELRIFATREEYLKLGEGPPLKWSGGHFTGGAVETYVGEGGFEQMTGTLFHEAAHQFVSLATNASGWLNEGLASFFEGCRILANGTVLMNLPADHYLFPLAERMEAGWMSSASDGIDPKQPETTPDKAPTFAIVLENQYEWGPPWYAPTWAVVYFLYNYQDPFDGRYVYRKALRSFIDASGGRMGEGAVKNFEEVVLAQPLAPYKQGGKPLERPAEFASVRLPANVVELDTVWKDWITALRDRQLGLTPPAFAWHRWARLARENGDPDVALEHFEKGLVATRHDPQLLQDFADFLLERKQPDRATQLALEAIRALEAEGASKAADLAKCEALIAKADPKRASLEKLHAEIWKSARELVQRYEAEELNLQLMEVAAHFSTELGVPDLLAPYERALRKTGRSIQLWELAYNESNMEGWNLAPGETFTPSGSRLDGKFETYAPASFDYRSVTLERVTSGDYSFEAQVSVEPGQGVFAGLVFGRKDVSTFHALLVFPGRKAAEEGQGQGPKTSGSGFVDLASFFGAETKTWRHNPVDALDAEGRSSDRRWTTLRIDVSDSVVDCWVDSALVASQDFGSASVLRGSFGLILGKGTAAFREVRYKARPAHDPAGSIERALVMDKLKASGEAVNGSYVGLVPPFPRVADWMQAPRANWEEKSGSPQLLVLWSIEQNEIVRISEWLNEFARENAATGLEIVSICSPNDSDAIEAYLAANPMPGSVGVDAREGVGIGETNKAFFTGRFNLPRLLLIDVDGKVVWEGDPGISASEPWQVGQETFVTVPFRDLVTKRKIAPFQAWLPEWRSVGAPALAEGDFERGWPALEQALQLDPVFPDVARARAQWQALDHALGDLPGCVERLHAQGRLAAFDSLQQWAQTMKKPIDKSKLVPLKALRTDASLKDWELARKSCQSYSARIAKDPTQLTELLARIEKLQGRFVEELRADLQRARDSDKDQLMSLLGGVEARPRRWLAQEFLRW